MTLRSGFHESDHGFAHVTVSQDDTAYVSNVTVPERKRGQGHGRALMTELTDAADTAGVTLTLHVARTNTVALRLYESLGFREAPDESFLAEVRDLVFMVRNTLPHPGVVPDEEGP